MMDELLAQFLIEGRDLVAEAQAALMVLGRDARDRAAFDHLFRATHTLKGSVVLFDMAPAERLLHAAETRLEAVRRADGALLGETLDIIVAIIDQTDRWIDAMEASGALDDDASDEAAMLLDRLEDIGQTGEPREERASPAPSSWLATLRDRPAFAPVDTGRDLTAFRYTPDPDCFFRGEDPLAVAAAVPDLVALAVLPAGDAWPALADCEPFRCASVLEGLSGANEDAVRAAFRMMPDQIQVERFSTLSPSTADALPSQAPSAMLRVDAERLDRLADQGGELSAAIRALRPISDRVRALDPHLASALAKAEEEIARVTATLRHAIAQVRLVSLEPVLRRLPRLAREAATRSGKTMRFTLEGETTQVDKQIADQIFEPLLHLVRNAIDHGIEPAGERTQNGKPGEGQISLSVTREGDNVFFLLADDGRGIDPDRVRATAVARNIMDAGAAAALDDASAIRLIFLPGFSTAARTTELSGRGVGMDAVQAAIDRLAGTIAIESEVRQGTRISLRLPVHAIGTPLLVVAAGGQQFGIRLDQVAETTRIAADAIQPVGQGHACILRDRTVPILDLAQLLGLPPVSGAFARLVVTDAGSSRVALRVAQFGERFDATVRRHTGLLAALPSVSGTTMMADGSALLVLDLAELAA